MAPRLVSVLTENWTMADPRDIRGIVRMAQEAEDAGFDMIMISDHVILRAAPGRIVAQGTPAELMDSRDPEVRQFVRGEPDGPVKFHYPARTMAEDFGLGAST